MRMIIQTKDHGLVFDSDEDYPRITSEDPPRHVDISDDETTPVDARLPGSLDAAST